MELCSKQIVLYLLFSVTALFAKYNIKTHTHTGVKTVFGLQFIKEGKVEAKWGKLLTYLFDTRQESDYGDFTVLTWEDILPLLKEVEEFKVMIMKLL